MSTLPNTPQYTEYHPRWYRKRVSTYWWSGSWKYMKFILRELSSIFVALGAGMTLLQINALRHGPEAYAKLEARMSSGFFITLAIISFLFVVFHSITWFNLAPSAMAVRVRGKRLPDIMIAAPNYFAWAAISAVVGWFILRS